MIAARGELPERQRAVAVEDGIPLTTGGPRARRAGLARLARTGRADSDSRRLPPPRPPLRRGATGFQRPAALGARTRPTADSSRLLT